MASTVAATRMSFAATYTGDGQVTISYDPSTDSCPISVVVTPRFAG
jgi:hypothetical protein